MQEPQYRGMNGKVDALSIGWLFVNDVLFFNDVDLKWDGSHHQLAGIQANSPMLSEAPVFASNRTAVSMGAAELLTEIEKDERLMVPLGSIADGLHKALRNEGMTGITLFNLQACGGALRFMQGSNLTAYGSMVGGSSEIDESGWSIAKDILSAAGMTEILEDPMAKSMTRVVMYDTRLAAGIPRFYELVRYMYEDMLAYNEIDLPFILVFVSSRNIDADQYLGEVPAPVEGAVSEGAHIESNVSEWTASRKGGAPAKEAAEGKTPNQPQGQITSSLTEVASQTASSMTDVASQLASAVGSIAGSKTEKAAATPSSSGVDLAEIASQSQRAIDLAKSLAELDLDYTVESLPLLDGILRALHDLKDVQNFNNDTLWNFASAFGSYLGETMLRNGYAAAGFAWGPDDDGEPMLIRRTKVGNSLGIIASGGEKVEGTRPVSKCYKCLLNGGQDNIHTYLDDMGRALGVHIGPGIEGMLKMLGLVSEEKQESPEEREAREAKERAEQERRAQEEQKAKAIAKTVARDFTAGTCLSVRKVRIGSATIERKMKTEKERLTRSEKTFEQWKSLDDEKANLEAELRSTETELSGLGFFAMGRKKELSGKVEMLNLRLKQTQTSLDAEERALSEVGRPDEIRATISGLEAQRADALELERKARSDSNAAASNMLVKAGSGYEPIKGNRGADIGFKYVDGSGTIYECYYSDSLEKRCELRGYSDEDLRNPFVLEAVARDYPTAFKAMENDPVAFAAIKKVESLYFLTEEGKKEKARREREEYEKSPEYQELRRLARAALGVLPAGEAVRKTWIMERVRGINTTKKCDEVMQILVDSGRVARVENVEGRYTGYKLI